MSFYYTKFLIFTEIWSVHIEFQHGTLLKTKITHNPLSFEFLLELPEVLQTEIQVMIAAYWHVNFESLEQFYELMSFELLGFDWRRKQVTWK